MLKDNTISFKKELEYYFIAFTLFCSIPPCYLWNSSVPIYFSILFSTSLLLFTKHSLSYSSLLLTMMYILIALISDNNFWGKILVLLICTIFFSDKRDLIGIWTCFRNIFTISLLLSLPIYVLVTFCGIDLPHTEIPSLNVNKNDTYLLYPFLVRTSSQLFDFNFRFFGMYDEPGVIGTFCAVFLICDHFDFKKRFNIVLLISGLLSMSLTFIGVVLLFILAQVSWKYKILIVIILTFLSISLYNNEIIYYYIFRRFSIEDGSFVGNNRTIDSFDYFYDQFKNSSYYLWGLGAGTSAVQNEGGSSYKNLIVDYGLLFFIMYVFALFTNGFSLTKWRNTIAYVLVIFLILYQRPFITSVVYVFMMVVSTYVINDTIIVNHENQI